jgi:cytochrome c-type biogenesis protein CcmH
MMLFFGGVLLLVGATLYVLLRPLWRPPAAADAITARLESYRRRLQELDQDLAAGTVADAEAAALRVELERELLAATADVPGNAPGRDMRLAGIVPIVVLLPLLAAGLYLQLGAPQFIAGPPEEAAPSAADIERMVDGLAERLRAQPDDETGWAMLARSYMVLGRYAEAATALEKLHGLTGDRADVLIRLADALAMQNGGKLAGRPADLVAKVLIIDARNEQALWLAGIASIEAGDAATALRHWEFLSTLLPADDPDRAQLDRLLEHARQQAAPSAAAESAVPVDGQEQ